MGRRTAPMPAAPDPISQNIDAVVALHQVAERGVDPHQRGVERLTAWLGRPQFFYGILVGAGLWMGVNELPRRLHEPHWDDPPFAWLQGLIGLLALLLTTVVLITQNRQGKLSERREQLDLQMSLLSEQRTAKIVELLEELRRDMPNVHDRRDEAAEAMTRTVDPHEVLATLEARMEEARGTDAASEMVAAEMDSAAAETERAVQEAKGEGAERPV